MATVNKGVAVVWGIPSARQAGTGFTTQKASFKEEANIKEILKEDGTTGSVVITDPKQSLSLTVYPSGATPGSCPTVGALVLVSAVTYLCMGATEEDSNDGEQVINMDLKKWGSVTLS